MFRSALLSIALVTFPAITCSSQAVETGHRITCINSPPARIDKDVTTLAIYLNDMALLGDFTTVFGTRAYRLYIEGDGPKMARLVNQLPPRSEIPLLSLGISSNTHEPLAQSIFRSSVRPAEFYIWECPGTADPLLTPLLVHKSMRRVILEDTVVSSHVLTALLSQELDIVVLGPGFRVHNWEPRDAPASIFGVNELALCATKSLRQFLMQAARRGELKKIRRLVVHRDVESTFVRMIVKAAPALTHFEFQPTDLRQELIDSLGQLEHLQVLVVRAYNRLPDAAIKGMNQFAADHSRVKVLVEDRPDSWLRLDKMGQAPGDGVEWPTWRLTDRNPSSRGPFQQYLGVYRRLE